MARNRDKYPPLLGFIDLLLNLAVAFAFLFMLSQMLINISKTQSKAPEREGSYLIQITWNEGIDADVDLWVLAPNNERSGFFSRDVQTMSLLRDDLGSTNDWYINDQGQQVLNKMNREEVTIRTPLQGKYVVNLHYFRAPADYQGKITVKVVLKKVKEDETLLERTLTLTSRGDELTAFTFTLDKQFNLVGSTKPEKPILWVVGSRGAPAPFMGP